MNIITSGSAYLDIDAYAGIIAYAELLNLQGQSAKAVSTAPLNESICKTIRQWPTPLETTYQPSTDDDYTIIDTSNPKNFDTFVDLMRVVEVIDHHPGTEAYWQQRLGKKATIDFIGAACTLVFERWLTAGLANKMSTLSARLLLCGILDNTLNFGAKVTTQRDKDAYEALLVLANLPSNWTAQYFDECQEAIMQDIRLAVQNDQKLLSFTTYQHELCVGKAAELELGCLKCACSFGTAVVGARESPWRLPDLHRVYLG